MLIEEPIAEKTSLLQRAIPVVMGSWAGVVDFLTPPKCLVCTVPVGGGATLCIACWQKLTFLDDPVCDALGTPFEFDQGAGALSPAAIADPPPWDKARAAVVFDAHSKPLVHSLKYQDYQEAGIAMARMMAAAGRGLIAEADVVVPVPLHRVRLWQRRFNQAGFLAQRIARGASKPYRPDILLRQRRTRQQIGLTAEERRKNVRRAFAVPVDFTPAVDGKSVLLIDDVRTTGATLAACSEALRDAGARQILVLTFALVLEPARFHIEV